MDEPHLLDGVSLKMDEPHLLEGVSLKMDEPHLLERVSLKMDEPHPEGWGMTWQAVGNLTKFGSE